MKLLRSHAYVVVPGMLIGGVLMGLTTGWGWVSLGVGAAIGGVLAPVMVVAGQWAGARLVLKPYRP